jgi:hypothetical protein
MPLPTQTQAWPPRALEPVFSRMDLWSAWYSGDPSELEAAMAPGGIVERGTNVFGERVPKSRAAGVFHKLTGGFFWSGRQSSNGSNEIKVHIPVASDIATMSADLIFGEAPKITLPEGTGADTKARLDEYLAEGMLTDFRESAEVDSALGGVYLRVVWDDTMLDRPWLQAVHPDMAVPEFSFGRLKAVTFWSEIFRDSAGRRVRHLEKHEPGYIFHGVYDGTESELGMAVPLSDWPETEDYAAQVDENGGIPTLVDELTVVYVPNVRPNRIWRKIPEAVPLGRSDYAGVEGAMDKLDLVWSSWMRDIRLGLARLVVPQSAIQSLGSGQGGLFDLDRELLVGLDLSLGPDESSITQVQFKIRHAEHEATAHGLLEQIVRGAGYSLGTFTGEGEPVPTATEVTAKERRSWSTRDKKIGYWAPAVRRAVYTLMLVDRAQFDTPIEPVLPKVEFPDAVSDPPETTARTLQLLNEAGAASRAIMVGMLHPTWGPAEIAAEVRAIEAQIEAAKPDIPAPGGPDDGPPSDD